MYVRAYVDLEFSQRFVANLVRNVNSAQAGHLAHQLNVPPNQRNQLEAEFPFNPAMVATRAVLFWQDNLAKGTFEDHRTILGRAFRACGMRRQASAVATYRGTYLKLLHVRAYIRAYVGSLKLSRK